MTTHTVTDTVTHGVTDEIKAKLLPYQVKHVESLLKSINKYGRVLDASDTGTGKTYSAIAVALALGLKPLIICPKSVLKSWMDVMKFFGVTMDGYYGLSNYESIKNCRYFPPTIMSKYMTDNSSDKDDCPYITRKKEVVIKKKKGNMIEKTNYIYKWKLPKDALLILDEAHRCKNKKTINSDILLTVAITSAKIMLLSATVADKPETFELAGFVLGLYKNIRDGKHWIRSVGANYDNAMKGVHSQLYPEYASRMKIRDLTNVFPENSVEAECFEMDCAKEIQEQYDLIDSAVSNLQEKENKSTALAKLTYARMRIEMLKSPTYIKLAQSFIDKGYSVAIFVNFTDSLLTIADELKTNCLIYGQQTLEQRNQNIQAFMDNTQKVIVCNIKSGGVGISLHDKSGKHPRVTIISPSWSAQDILQSLGRVYRAGGKTKVLQKIVFCNKTVEEDICANVKAKIMTIGCLNDGDEFTYEIKNFIETNGSGTDGDSDMYANLTDFEKLYLQINVLNIKKNRLQNEIKEVDNEIKEYEAKLNTLIK